MSGKEIYVKEDSSGKERIIAMINHKGGVGKTTSVINIGAGLAKLGKSVLLVDLDAQANLTCAMGIEDDTLDKSVYDLLQNGSQLNDVLVQKNGLSILPSSIELLAAELELVHVAGRETRLKEVLADTHCYDVILLDCPPNLGLLTLNALTVAKEVLVPLQVEFFSMKGLKIIMEIVEKVRQNINPDIQITGLFPTQYDSRLKLHSQVYEVLQTHYKDHLLGTFIRRNVALAEATSHGETIFHYSPRSHGAKDYLTLCQEIMNKG